MPPMLDWSWAQAYEAPALLAQPTPIHLDGAKPAGILDDPSASKPAEPNLPLFPNGFHINHDMRVAVPLKPCQRTTGPFAQSPPMPSTSSATETCPPSTSATTRPSFAGRKRSCAEISDDDSSDRNLSTSSGATSASPTKGDIVYGPGMTLTHTNSATGAWDGSQTGRWAEELAERLQSSSFPEGRERDRPSLGESRKSMRLDQDTARRGDASGGLDRVAEFAGEPGAARPVHDDAALALGVGWGSLPTGDAISAAARGWARYIETAFPVRSAKVVWRNEGLGAFLVGGVTRSGSPGYFLFDEGLTQGRLVAKSWERCLDNLREVPFVYEGEGVMVAEEQGRAQLGDMVVDGLDEVGGSAQELGMDVD